MRFSPWSALLLLPLALAACPPAQAAAARLETVQHYARSHPEAQIVCETLDSVRRRMDELRKTDPEAAAIVAQEFGEIVSVNVSEDRFHDMGYPEAVAGRFNRSPAEDLKNPDLDVSLTPEKLRASLPVWISGHLTPEWAARQAELGNPEVTGADGKPLSGADMAEWLRVRKASADFSAKRWDKRLFPEGKAVPVAERATKAQAALNSLYARSVAGGAGVNGFAAARERVAALSVVDAVFGTQNKSVDPVLFMSDVAVLAAAVESRSNPEGLRGTLTVETVRAKNLDGLVARAKALLPAAAWDSLYGSSCPAGAEEGGREHLSTLLDQLFNDVSNSYGVPADKIAALNVLRRDIQVGQKASTTVPVVSESRAMAALETLGIAGKPGTPDHEAVRALVSQTLPKFFESVATGLQKELERKVGAVPDARKAKEMAAREAAELERTRADIAQTQAQAAQIRGETAQIYQETAQIRKEGNAAEEVGNIFDQLADCVTRIDGERNPESRSRMIAHMQDLLLQARRNALVITDEKKRAEFLAAVAVFEKSLPRLLAKNG